MKFDDLLTLCAAARFIHFEFANGDDVLTMVNISASDEESGCFAGITSDDEYDYVIRKEDFEAARFKGNVLKVKALVADTDAQPGEEWIEHNDDHFILREADVRFMALSELNPARVLYGDALTKVWAPEVGG